MSHAVRHLDLVVTEACNLACTYCFASQRSGRHLDAALARRAVAWLCESSRPRLHVTFWGGEPLLRLSLLRELLPHARRCAEAAGKQIGFSLPTNGTLLDEETLGWLRENQIRIFVSIDGDRLAQSERRLRNGASSHELASRGLELALAGASDLGAPAVRMTVTPENALQLRSSVRFLVDAGARELLIHAALDQPWPDAALARFSEGQLQLADWLVESLQAAKDPASVPVLRSWRGILRRLAGGKPLRDPARPAMSCGAGGELVAVGVDGALHPCHRFVFYGRGHQVDTRLGSLMEPAGLGDPRFTPPAGELHGARPCSRCEIFSTCTLGCVAVSHATSGDLRAVPPHACALMEAQVAACRRVQAQLGGDPRYALYLGSSLPSLLQRTSRRLGQRAFALWATTSPLNGPAREGAGQPLASERSL